MVLLSLVHFSTQRFFRTSDLGLPCLSWSFWHATYHKCSKILNTSPSIKQEWPFTNDGVFIVLSKSSLAYKASETRWLFIRLLRFFLCNLLNFILINLSAKEPGDSFLEILQKLKYKDF